MNYSQALAFMNDNLVSFQTAGRTAYKGGLDSITAMCRIMGDPQNSYRTIHVAGTNGKGSVCHTLASILSAAGYRTGLFTSPHLHDFRERIRLDGAMAPQDYVADFLTRHADNIKELGLSYFELTTAMAFAYFAEAGADIAVIETGLGGRLDATNIIRPQLSVVTNIGLDHTDILGDTISAIAAEKAGIIKQGVPVVIGESDPQSAPVFRERCRECGSEIVFADRTFDCVPNEEAHRTEAQSFTVTDLRTGTTEEVTLDLLGTYQRKNLATVCAAVDTLRRTTDIGISEDAFREGCRHAAASTGLTGRWQILSSAPLTVADGGHNTHGMREIVRQIAMQHYDRLYMVLGVAADKDVEHILDMMPRDAYYIFTQADSPRAMPAERLTAAGMRHGLAGETCRTPKEALERARALAGPEDMIFIGGSFYMISALV